MFKTVIITLTLTVAMLLGVSNIAQAKDYSDYKIYEVTRPGYTHMVVLEKVGKKTILWDTVKDKQVKVGWGDYLKCTPEYQVMVERTHDENCEPLFRNDPGLFYGRTTTVNIMGKVYVVVTRNDSITVY